MARKLPARVRAKTAKGTTYYYFAAERDSVGRQRLIRLPEPAHPSFATAYAVALASFGGDVRQRRTHVRDFTYFIGGEEGPIKIGRAISPEARLRDLQAANPQPLRVLALRPGGGEERDYHRRFAEHRLSGEWFTRHPDIEAEIAHLNAIFNEAGEWRCENRRSDFHRTNTGAGIAGA